MAAPQPRWEDGYRPQRCTFRSSRGRGQAPLSITTRDSVQVIIARFKRSSAPQCRLCACTAKWLFYCSRSGELKGLHKEFPNQNQVRVRKSLVQGITDIAAQPDYERSRWDPDCIAAAHFTRDSGRIFICTIICPWIDRAQQGEAIHVKVHYDVKGKEKGQPAQRKTHEMDLSTKSLVQDLVAKLPQDATGNGTIAVLPPGGQPSADPEHPAAGLAYSMTLGDAGIGNGATVETYPNEKRKPQMEDEKLSYQVDALLSYPAAYAGGAAECRFRHVEWLDPTTLLALSADGNIWSMDITALRARFREKNSRRPVVEYSWEPTMPAPSAEIGDLEPLEFNGGPDCPLKGKGVHLSVGSAPDRVPRDIAAACDCRDMAEGVFATVGVPTPQEVMLLSLSNGSCTGHAGFLPFPDGEVVSAVRWLGSDLHPHLSNVLVTVADSIRRVRVWRVLRRDVSDEAEVGVDGGLEPRLLFDLDIQFDDQEWREIEKLCDQRFPGAAEMQPLVTAEGKTVVLSIAALNFLVVLHVEQRPGEQMEICVSDAQFVAGCKDGFRSGCGVPGPDGVNYDPAFTEKDEVRMRNAGGDWLKGGTVMEVDAASGRPRVQVGKSDAKVFYDEVELLKEGLLSMVVPRYAVSLVKADRRTVQPGQRVRMNIPGEPPNQWYCVLRVNETESNNPDDSQIFLQKCPLERSRPEGPVLKPTLKYFDDQERSRAHTRKDKPEICYLTTHQFATCSLRLGRRGCTSAPEPAQGLLPLQWSGPEPQHQSPRPPPVHRQAAPPPAPPERERVVVPMPPEPEPPAPEPAAPPVSGPVSQETIARQLEKLQMCLTQLEKFGAERMGGIEQRLQQLENSQVRSIEEAKRANAEMDRHLRTQRSDIEAEVARYSGQMQEDIKKIDEQLTVNVTKLAEFYQQPAKRLIQEFERSRGPEQQKQMEEIADFSNQLFRHVQQEIAKGTEMAQTDQPRLVLARAVDDELCKRVHEQIDSQLGQVADFQCSLVEDYASIAKTVEDKLVQRVELVKEAADSAGAQGVRESLARSDDGLRKMGADVTSQFEQILRTVQGFGAQHEKAREAIQQQVAQATAQWQRDGKSGLVIGDREEEPSQVGAPTDPKNEFRRLIQQEDWGTCVRRVNDCSNGAHQFASVPAEDRQTIFQWFRRKTDQQKEQVLSADGIGASEKVMLLRDTIMAFADAGNLHKWDRFDSPIEKAAFQVGWLQALMCELQLKPMLECSLDRNQILVPLFDYVKTHVAQGRDKWPSLTTQLRMMEVNISNLLDGLRRG